MEFEALLDSTSHWWGFNCRAVGSAQTAGAGFRWFPWPWSSGLLLVSYTPGEGGNGGGTNLNPCDLSTGSWATGIPFWLRYQAMQLGSVACGCDPCVKGAHPNNLGGSGGEDDTEGRGLVSCQAPGPRHQQRQQQPQLRSPLKVTFQLGQEWGKVKDLPERQPS